MKPWWKHPRNWSKWRNGDWVPGHLLWISMVLAAPALFYLEILILHRLT